MHTRIVIITCLLLVLGSCTAEWKIPPGYIVECNDKDDCPDTAECLPTDDGKSHVCITDGETFCGNGVQEVGEACDDGNQSSDDYCASDCKTEFSICGDGRRTLDEVCDAGSQNSDAYQQDETCLNDCSGYGNYCGDGEITDQEECDDSNQKDDGNGCSSTCTKCTSQDQCPKSGAVSCGDYNVHTAFETCDDGLSSQGIPVTELCIYEDPACFVCDENCILRHITDIPRCGDGIIQNAGGDYGTEACEQSLPCNEVHPSFTSGTTTCSEDCQTIDFSNCSGAPADMVFVPQGFFWMGCNTEIDDECMGNEYPYHEVYLTNFMIDRLEVTASDYKSCVDAGDCTYTTDFDGGYHTFDNGRDDHPINTVTWDNANNYCQWADKRLPTEAEWEKAARGPHGQKYPWGNTPERSCDYVVMAIEGQWPNTYGCGENRTWPVESKPLGISPYGALDMIGSVFEWTADWLDQSYYGQTPENGWNNPLGPGNGTNRVLRGGAFQHNNHYLRASYRGGSTPDTKHYTLGFRCAR